MKKLKSAFSCLAVLVLMLSLAQFSFAADNDYLLSTDKIVITSSTTATALNLKRVISQIRNQIHFQS